MTYNYKSFVVGNTAKNKSLELNQIVGAKSSSNECFYRAKVIEKSDGNNFGVLFIDFGFEEFVNFADIVLLPLQLQQVQFNLCINLHFANLLKLHYI